jgi:hypothetical protein
MATNFQSAVTFVLMIFFSKFLLQIACVKNLSFWLQMAPLAQGVGQKWFFCHNFGGIQLFSICFCISFVLSARKFNGRKVFEKS